MNMLQSWRHAAALFKAGLAAAALSAGLAGCGGGSSEPSASAAVLAVAPTITSAPAAAGLTEGSTAVFSVIATGTAPLAYQWLRNGVSIAGATAASYSLPSVSVTDSGAQFSVVVSNSAGSTASASATLTVAAVIVAPAIAVAPQSSNALDGSTAILSVVASGTAPFTYAWQRNGNAIVGAAAASYTTPTLTLADSGVQYRVVVANASGSVTSAAATITVNPVPPSIASAPVAVAVTAGQTATFSAVATGSAPLNYQWQRNGVAIAGATSASYTIAATTVADSGVRFRVVVTNSGGNVTSAEATLTVSAAILAPAIATAPQNAVVQEGQTATFTATATGTAPLSYQWLRNGTAIAGATATSYTTPATTVAADNGARYALRVANAAGNVTSADAVLTVQAPSSGLIGRSWASAQPLETDDNNVFGRAATIDDAGRVTVLFQKSNWTRNVLYTIRGTPNAAGASPIWTTPVPIDLLNGTPVSDMGSSPAYAVTAAPGGDVVATWFHNARCTAATYRASTSPFDTCKYHYFAKFSISSGTWSSPTLLTDAPGGLFQVFLNDRGDLAFLGTGWTRRDVSLWQDAIAVFSIGAGATELRSQLPGQGSMSNALMGMDDQGNLLLAAQVQQNATNDIVAYRGTASSLLGSPVTIDTRGAAASLRLAAVGRGGQQAVMWTQNNGVTSSTYAATAESATAAFSVRDLAYDIDTNTTLVVLTISDGGVAQYLEIGFFSRRKRTWSAANGWSDNDAAPPNELYAHQYAINRNGELLVVDSDGAWGSYDNQRNVMVQSIRTGTRYVLGVSSSAASIGSPVLSVGGIGFATLLNRFDVLPTPAVPAGDGRTVTNLWGAFLK
jgi:hypothetical protein